MATRGRASTVLVLRGEAGIGKTALLEHAASSAKGKRVLRTRGIQSESELAFSGLLELLRPLVDHLDRIPERQAAALKGALALEAADEDDAFAVYAGTLSLLVTAAEDEPLLVLIDDAHWLDRGSAEALAFASRRLGSEGIAVLWAIREGEQAGVSTEGLDEVVLHGLESDAALELVETAGEKVSPDAARALVTITNGNPLALLELPRMMTPGQREGREPLEQPLPASPALQEAFGRRLERLPEEVRTMLLVSAASDGADLGTILRAWQLIGLAPSRLQPAERAGVVTIGQGRLEFRHPLLRAAVYASADDVERRKAHGLLAEALDDPRAQGRRAWHRALAAVEPDEAVAAELEAIAMRSAGRSWHAAARAYEQAARLTPEDEPRARRLLAAAREWQGAGRGDTARELLEEAESLTEDQGVLADSEHLLGYVLALQGEARRAAELLERAAARISDTDPVRAALILADAAEPWLSADCIDRAEASARRAWELASGRGGGAELWAALRYADVLGWRGAVERATELWLHAADIPVGDNVRNRCAAGEALFSAGEDERARAALEEAIELARATNSLGILPWALQLLAMVETRRGRLRAAIAAATEARELAMALDQRGEALMALGILLWAEALLGREGACHAHLRDSSEFGQRFGLKTGGAKAVGMLELSQGHFEEAIGHFEVHVAEIGPRVGADAIAPRPFVPSLIEAYVRAGKAEEARAELETYKALATRSGRPSALAPALRCRAILDGTEQDFDAALAEHERWENPFERARTQLLYGEFLRREKRRADARVQLRAALSTFEEAGAAVWAERARTELRATGERARRREPSTIDELTPQELNVARLVCEGLTNREVAARLFLSPKTIETHLGHVFRKLDVRTRTELARRFRDPSDSIAAPAS
jgi:DNA-binding CsgD family transcriptional regulator